MKAAIVSPMIPSKGGVAEVYTNYLYEEIKKLDKDVVVLADKLDFRVKEDRGIIRCWDKKPRYVYQILREIVKREIKIVHIQQELHIFGSKFNAFLLPFLILALRLMGKKVVITLHGVVPLKAVNENFLKENSYSGNPFIMKLGLNFLYSFICLFPNKVIVHENKFKEYLKEYYISTKKVKVINLGIKEIKKLIDKKEARKKLKIDKKYTFLYFGYVTGYKGIELIISALKRIKDKDFNFVIVGSEHPRLKNDRKYNNYYNKIKNFFEKDKRCKFTGYVPEEDVNLYFRATDCAVFPYTTQMSSSGPMAQAIANETLVIASDAFGGVLPKDLIFKKTKEDLINLMKRAKEGRLDNQSRTIKKMKQELSWKNIAKKTLDAWKK